MESTRFMAFLNKNRTFCSIMNKHDYGGLFIWVVK